MLRRYLYKFYTCTGLLTSPPSTAVPLGFSADPLGFCFGFFSL